MKNIVLKYGLISGLILTVLCAIHWPVMINQHLPEPWGMVVGFSTMILAFTAVFFGIRAYRDKQGGELTFGRGLQVGLLIALITCAFYVIGWEIVYWNFIPDFADRYAAMTISRMQADGASAAEIAKTRAEMAQFKEMYANPIYNTAVTFMEIFPVGLIISVLSAAILRRKSGPAVAATA
ncbi:MAG TPA: DUF4199 domain-containing protein [Thermoanaerobaculia bacterium]|nr:DUF4199 domain-containing protein [Thermoanaerobaculia bacterium]